MTDPENLKLVRDLCESWGAADYDPDKMAKAYFTADCRVRFMHTLPFAEGPAAVAAQAKSLMPLGTERVKVKYLSTYVTGFIVVNHRIDTFIVPGKPNADFEVIGVFMIEGGKIKEWTDHLVTH